MTMVDWEVIFTDGSDEARMARAGYRSGVPSVALPDDMLSYDILLRRAVLMLLPSPPERSWAVSEIEGVGEARRCVDSRKMQWCVSLDTETARALRDELKRRERYGKP
jgi:hypothetical protein